MKNGMIPTKTPGFVIDPRTRTVINTNESEYLAYKAAATRAKNIEQLSERMDKVENKLDDIMAMLVQALGPKK